MEKITEQLDQLRLNGMSRCWKTLRETKQIGTLDLNETLQLLLQSEQEDRDERRFKRLEKNATFRYSAAIEELKYTPDRALSKVKITELSMGNYIKNGEAILITGSTGCGKSFLSSALGHQACAMGYRVLYFNVQKLLIKTKLMRVDGTIYRFMNKLKKTDLLILDDFGITSLEKQQQLDFMEIIEDRHAKMATIISSQLPIGNWYDVFQEETIADAVLDRLVHTSHKIQLKGESMRKLK